MTCYTCRKEADHVYNGVKFGFWAHAMTVKYDGPAQCWDCFLDMIRRTVTPMGLEHAIITPIESDNLP
jgi:hypothetical protein